MVNRYKTKTVGELRPGDKLLAMRYSYSRFINKRPDYMSIAYLTVKSTKPMVGYPNMRMVTIEFDEEAKSIGIEERCGFVETGSNADSNWALNRVFPDTGGGYIYVSSSSQYFLNELKVPIVQVLNIIYGANGGVLTSKVMTAFERLNAYKKFLKQLLDEDHIFTKEKGFIELFSYIRERCLNLWLMMYVIKSEYK